MSRQAEPTPFDGRDFGAACDACPLNGSIVVPPTTNRRPLAIILAECPGATEEIKRQPLVGESGQIVDRIIDRCGEHRDNFHLTNVLLCKAPKTLSPKDWKQAKACCRPRLEKELSKIETKSIIALGKHALEAATGHAKITDYMGAPLEGIGSFDGYKVLPMYHPAMALREPQWITVLARHLSRGILMAKGQLPTWAWPEFHCEGPGLTAALRTILKRKELTATDVENVSLEPVADPAFKLLNVGFAISDLMVSVQWDTCTPLQQKLAAQILAHARIPKVCQNGQHDILALERVGLKLVNYIYDTIYSSTVITPQLPKGLGVQCAIYFHGPRWKTVFRATKDDAHQNRFLHSDPYERALYNAQDCWMTLLLWLAHQEELPNVHNGQALLNMYMKLNVVAVDMRRRGFRTNPSQLEHHKKSLGRRMRSARHKLQRMAYDLKLKLLKDGELVAFNPNSNQHVNSLFVDGLGCMPSKFSEKTQAASWDEKVITRLASNPNPEVRYAARCMLKFRKNSKYLSSFVMALYREEDRGKGKKPRLHIMQRVHACPNPFGTIVGRWAYKEPSLQVIPKPETRELKTKRNAEGKPISVVESPGMRDLYRADPGCYLVEVDYSQLQAYILAIVSNDPKMLEMLTVCPPGWKKADIHKATAIMLCELMEVQWGDLSEKEQDRLRQLCKKARYQWQFGSTPDNAWKVLVVEIPDLAISQLEKLWMVLDDLHPQAVAWRRVQKKHAFDYDFVEAPISGRRYYFHGHVEPTKCYNLPIIMSEADEVNPAVLRVFSNLKEDENMIAQIHDSILCQGPDPIRLGKMMKEQMEKGGVFKVDVKVSKFEGDWGNMTDLAIR